MKSNDTGGISLQGILGLLVIVGIVWGAALMMPAVQVPQELKNAVLEECKEWLRLHAREQTISAKRRTEIKIKEIIAEQLNKHIYDPKNLAVTFIGGQTVNVILPYTLKINLYGFDLKFDKELNIQENAISF